MRLCSVITFGVWLSLLSIGAINLKAADDADAKTKLIGTWVVPQEQYTPVIRGGETSFKGDGTFTSFALLRIRDQQIRIDVQGKWKVEKGVLIEEITKSSKEQMVPVGLISRDTLLEVNEKTYRYRSEKGQERHKLRKPN